MTHMLARGLPDPAHLQAVRDLQAALREKDAELKEVRNLLDDAAELQSQDVQTARIIELSKKNRQLVLNLEKEKQRTSKLQADLNAAVKSSQPAKTLDPQAIEGIARSVVEQAAEAAEAANKEAASWKDRCQQQTNKMAQLEQKLFALEIETKKLTRALVREVGDEIPLSKVLDEGSDWKGRRELVLSLKNQLQALKAAQGLAPETKHEVAARKVMAKVSGVKSAELDQLKADLAAARAEADSLRTKADGAVSRRKILETELSGLKDKVSVILNKTQNDDRLIAALRAELAAVKKQEGGVTPERVGRPPVEEDDELWRELGALRRRCAEQAGQVERYESTVQALNDRLATAHHQLQQAAASKVQQRPGSSASMTAGQSRGGTPPGKTPAPGVLSTDPERLSPGRGPNLGLPRGSHDPLGSAGAQLAKATSGQLRSSPSQGAVEAGRVSSSTVGEVRDAAAVQQLKLAEVEISRLQELVQLLQNRVQELEDEIEERSYS